MSTRDGESNSGLELTYPNIETIIIDHDFDLIMVMTLSSVHERWRFQLRAGVDVSQKGKIFIIDHDFDLIMVKYL